MRLWQTPSPTNGAAGSGRALLRRRSRAQRPGWRRRAGGHGGGAPSAGLGTATWLLYPDSKSGFGGVVVFFFKTNKITLLLLQPSQSLLPLSYLLLGLPPALPQVTKEKMTRMPGPFLPHRPAMLATAVPASLREASALRGLCGACSTASISLHSSGVASFSRLNASAPPKSLSHPPLTPMLLTALTNPTLGRHPSLRTRVYIPGPITLLYSRSLFSLCLRPSPFSCLEHISNPTCPKPQPVTKYTG